MENLRINIKKTIFIVLLLSALSSWLYSETFLSIMNVSDKKVTGSLWTQEEATHKPIHLVSIESEVLYDGFIQYSLESGDYITFYSEEMVNKTINIRLEDAEEREKSVEITIEKDEDDIELVFFNDFVGYRLTSNSGKELGKNEFYVLNENEAKNENYSNYTVEIVMEIMGNPLPIVSNFSSLVITLNGVTYSLQQVDIIQSNTPNILQAYPENNLYKVRDLQGSWTVQIQMEDSSSAKVTLIVKDEEGNVVLQDQASGAYGVASVSSWELQ